MSEAPRNDEDLANRTYEPPEEFLRQANVNDPSIYEKAKEDYEGFWAERARELHWFKEWDQVLTWKPPFGQWFVGGKLNAAYNCLDIHVEQGKGDKTALIWRATSLASRGPTPTRSFLPRSRNSLTF